MREEKVVDYGEDVEFDPKATTYKEIVMLHYNRCIKFIGVEFRGGYYTIVPTKDGQDKEVYIPDTREIFSNAIKGLAIMLRPRFDKKMQEAWDKYKEDLQKIKKEFIDASTPDEQIILGDSFYETPQDKLLLETYKQKKLDIYLELFCDCCDLLGRKNYLTIGAAIF